MRSLRLRGHDPNSAKDNLIAKPAIPELKPADPMASGAAAVPKVKKQRFRRWRALNRNVRFAIIALVLLAFGAGSVFYYKHVRPEGQSYFSITKHQKVAPKTVASPLTGVQVAPALAARPVTGIMIENSDDARPQSGLQDAGVVYEAIAEGGVTRFLALFQDSSPQYIGPVRSLRPYYIDFAAPFQASIVHVGGSPDALSEVENGSFRNLDQFANGGYFTRVSSRDAPHNVYTSFAELDKLNAAKGYTSSKFTSWPRKADKKLTTPTARTIQLAISGPDFYANYTYDAKTDSYLRSEGGAPHLDLASASDTTGVQLNPKVVIALVMPLSNGALDATGAYYSEYNDTGSGNAYIFQDGGVTQGTWNKSGTENQISFTNSAGQAIKLNAGQTWITVLSADNQVTYSP
jgi:hypothetical protein